MTKYRVIIDKDKCVDCGISVGRCPVHARLLARLLKPNSKQVSDELASMGVFTESLHNYVRKLVEACPEKALIIEKIQQKRAKRV